MPAPSDASLSITFVQTERILLHLHPRRPSPNCIGLGLGFLTLSKKPFLISPPMVSATSGNSVAYFMPSLFFSPSMRHQDAQFYTFSSYTAKQTDNLITILLNVFLCKLYAVFVLSHSFYSIFPFISFIHHESGVSPSIFTLSPGATTRFQRSMIVWFIASISTNSGCFANASSESN